MPNSAYLSRKVANEVVRNLASSDMVTLFRINELNSDSCSDVDSTLWSRCQCRSRSSRSQIWSRIYVSASSSFAQDHVRCNTLSIYLVFPLLVWFSEWKNQMKSSNLRLGNADI